MNPDHCIVVGFVLYLRLMKNFLKNLVVSVLAGQVRRLRAKHQFKVVGVVGSIGKTSTKLAIAQTLGKNLRVRYQNGNYNDIVSVPLIFFGHDLPELVNPIAWFKIFADNNKQIAGDYPYDVVVIELGTDGPGQIAQFKKYLQLDIAVVTAIAPEHMEYFSDINAVAAEELSVASYSKQIVYNADLVASEYLANLPAGGTGYSIKRQDHDYYLSNIFHSSNGLEADVKHAGEIFVHIAQEVVSETQLYSSLAAVVVGNLLGLKNVQIIAGLSAITPVSGRLRRLRGINSSVIIDDTYNSSPEAVKAGLETLHGYDAPQRIAVLGSMNELGAMSADAHKHIGELIDPSKLSLLVTIGAEANQYTAKAAEARGVMVKTFDSPYDAGDYLQTKVEQGAVIFAKGSQNGVFAEETVKKLLADPEDASKLVRQSDYWLKRKEQSFKKGN